MYVRRKRGSYLVIFGFMLLVMVGFAALAVDVSYIRLGQIQAQNVADAGAHAAIVAYRDKRGLGVAEAAALVDSRGLAEDVMNLNTVVGDPVLVDPATDIVFGEWDFVNQAFFPNQPRPNAASVQVRRTDGSPMGPMELLLATIFDTTFADVQSNQASVGAMRFRDIMVVQDVSGSFTGEIGQAIDADLLFLDIVFNNGLDGDQMGMVLFDSVAWYENPALEIFDVQADYASQRPRWDNERVGCCNGATNHYDGIRLAKETLIDETAARNAAEQAATFQAIIFVSDGRPNSGPNGGVGTDQADMAEALGMSIYPLYLDQGGGVGTTAFNEMKKLERGFGLNQMRFTSNASELSDLMLEIGRSMPISIVR